MPMRRRGNSTAAWPWLWVVLSSTTAMFHIGSRQGDEIRDLIGDAFLGWLVSDGYGAYRKFKKRQRCLAHLIRKGIALAGGLNPQGAHIGAWLPCYAERVNDYETGGDSI